MSEWQKIESAPKDIMVLIVNVKWPASLQKEQTPPIKIGFLCTCSNSWKIFGASWMPTHWMPLPSPPQDDK